MNSSKKMRALSRVNHIWIERYKYNDVIRFRRPMIAENHKGGGLRKRVDTFSKAAARRFHYAFATREREFKRFLTVTFPREIEFGPVEGRRLLKSIARTARKRDLHYLWVIEPQKDGTPHYHILTDDVDDYIVETVCRVVSRLLTEKLKKFQLSVDVSHRIKKDVLHRFLRWGVKNEKIKNQDQANCYMGKTCAYMGKAAKSGPDGLQGFKRWGRNYLSAPIFYTFPDAVDLPVIAYEVCKQRANDIFSVSVVLPVGYLQGGGDGRYHQEINWPELELPAEYFDFMPPGAHR